MRYFNTAGPCDPGSHYMLPTEPRVPFARELIEMDRYFVVHGPRQCGKTTTLRALARALNAEGRVAALWVSLEKGKVAGDDYGAGESLVLDAIRRAAVEEGLDPVLLPPDPWPDAVQGARVMAALGDWAAACPRPLVLFFDEIDALWGRSLISVLTQLRDGHNTRPHRAFPSSVVLCGMRNVRDFKMSAGIDPERLSTASPFNIAARTIRLADFTRVQVGELYGQHTVETEQEFTEAAVDRAYEVTCGQPWLVNALADEMTQGFAPAGTITADHVDRARERVIRARAAHLDSLVARLHEPRVRRVIEPIVAGTFPPMDPGFDDDVSYVRDLGLITSGPALQIANPIYREVILRVLGAQVESMVLAEPKSFVLPDGRLDMPGLLRGFGEFWSEHGEVVIRQEGYHEAACQVVMMAYLHRLVNGGGYLDREYAAGTRRLDVLVRWPYDGPDGKRAVQREALELKVWHEGEADPLAKGLAQLDGYLDRLSLDTGVLVVFDRRREAAPWAERVSFTLAKTPAGRKATVLRA